MTATSDLADPSRGRLVARLLGGPLAAEQAGELPAADARALRELSERGHVEVGRDGSVRLASATRDRFLDRLLTAVLGVTPAGHAPAVHRSADRDTRAAVPGAVHPAR